MYGKLHRFLTIYMQVSALLEISVVKFDFEMRIYFDVKNRTNLSFIFFYVKISEFWKLLVIVNVNIIHAMKKITKFLMSIYRSVNYNVRTGECALSEMDRSSVANPSEDFKVRFLYIFQSFLQIDAQFLKFLSVSVISR